MGELDPRAVPCQAGSATARLAQTLLGVPGAVQGFPCPCCSSEQHPGMPQCQEMPPAFLVPQFTDLITEKEGKEEIF